jgi:predicted metal-dependent peptidase
MTMSNSEEYTGIKTAMLLHVPFFASLLLDIMTVKVGKFPHVFGTAIDEHGNVLPQHLQETMATDGKTIWIDEDFIKRIPLECSVFGVAHELSHTMWEHMARGKRYADLGFDGEPFDHMLFNVAADFLINDMLVKAGVGKMKYDANGKPEWLLSAKYEHDKWTPEDVYRDLKKNGMPKDCPGGGRPGGSGGAQMDKHIYNSDPINPAEMKRAIQTALDTAKAMGKLPAALSRFAEDFLEPKVKWEELLRTTVITAASRDTTSWARPHRRRLASQGIYLARPSAFGCRLIVWVWDTSGSIGQTEMNLFGGECKDIIRTCHPERTYLVGCDAAVASVHEFGDGEEIDWSNTEVKGGGGTDFRPPFEWVKKQGLEPDCLIYFTDMMGPFPDEDPGYPVVWCSTTADQEGKPSFGKVIHVDLAT